MGLAKTIKIWKCDSCGKEEAWNDNWFSRMIIHGRGYGSWEEDIVACSQECADKLNEKYLIGKKQP